MSKNMIEKAREAVEGFAGLYEKTEQRLSLSGYSGSTSENYLRELARISLQFGTIPDNLAEEQINSYLQGLTNRYTKQQGTFKMAVWGLRYYFRKIKNQQTSIGKNGQTDQPITVKIDHPQKGYFFTLTGAN